METKRCSSVRDECLTNGDICKSKRRWAVKFESFFFLMSFKARFTGTVGRSELTIRGGQGSESFSPDDCPARAALRAAVMVRS